MPEESTPEEAIPEEPMPEQHVADSEVVVEADPVRPLPAERSPGTIEIWGHEVGPMAVAATAGAAAGIAAVAVSRSRSQRRPPRRGIFRRRERVVARRSFLVDVHVLGR